MLIAQWVQTSGPAGGKVNSIVFAPNNTIFAGLLTGGVFLSTDTGKSWTAMNKGLENTYKNVQAMALSSDSSDNSNTLLISVYGDVYRSIDYGATWTASSLNGAQVNAMTVLNHGNKGNTIIASGGSGTFRSTDNGISWALTNCSTITSMELFTCMNTLSGDRIIFGASGVYGVNFSTDDGLNWSTVQNELSHQYITSIAAVGQDVYAGTFSVLYRSKDFGNTWSVVSTGLANPNIHCLTASYNGSSLLMESGSGVYRTTDSGNSWLQICANLPGTANALKLFVENDSSFYAGSYLGGVYHSTNAGKSWQAMNKGLMPLTVNNVVPYSNNTNSTEIYACTQENGVLRTTDNGENWDLISSGLTNYKAYALLALPRKDGGKNLFAGTYGGGVFLSTDNGANWNASNTRLTNLNVFSLAAAVNASGDTTLIAGTLAGMYRSTDNGATWYAANSGFSGYLVDRFIVYPASTGGQNILAGANNYKLFLSTDYGNSWTAASTGLIGTVYGLASGTDKTTSTSLYAATDNGVFVSTNNGASWSQTYTSAVNSLTVLSPFIFAGCNNGGITISTDNGNSWTVTDTLPVKTGIYSILTDGKFLFTVSGQNIFWRRPLSEIINDVKINRADLAPTKFELKQNHPNPFNPATTIEYNVPERTHVQLFIYNMLGRKICELVNEDKSSGSYRVTFDASHLSSGVYFYSMHAAGYTQTRKLIVVK